MKWNGVRLYVLYFTILNRTEQCRRMQIVMETTVLAYLPAAHSLPDQNKKPGVYQQVPSRSRALQALHEGIQEAFEPIPRYPLTGFSIRTKCGAILRSIFVVSSYTADTLHSKDCLTIKQGVLTSFPSPRCFTTKHNMNQHCQYPFRNVKEMLPLISAFHSQKMNVNAQDMSKRVSMHNSKLILSEFTNVRSDFHKNIYIIFCFKPMHNPFLGISKSLKNYDFERLCDQPYSQVKRQGLMFRNCFLLCEQK